MLTQLINPLHTTEYINQQIIHTGYYDPSRMTGDTTAKALETLAHAIRNPHSRINIPDLSTAEARCLVHRIKDIIQALNLRNIHIKQTQNTVGVSFT